MRLYPPHALRSNGDERCGDDGETANVPVMFKGEKSTPISVETKVNAVVLAEKDVLISGAKSQFRATSRNGDE